MQQYRVNKEIRAQRVMLILPTGKNVGEIAFQEAFKLAQELSLDIVQVSPDTQIPVVKIADYQKMVFDAKKQENHKKKSSHEVKDISISVNISSGDLNTKICAVRRILSEGDVVQFFVKPMKAWEPEARVKALQMAFEKAKEVHAILSHEKGLKTTQPVKAERVVKFYVNPSK